MELDGRSILLGAGLFGMVVGASLGLVAGAEYRACIGSFVGPGMLVCEGYKELRIASFGLVGLSALVSLIPLVGLLRERAPVRLVWRR